MRQLIIATLIFQFSCTTKQHAPLENTVKLIKKGHGDLYENGALEVPYTTVKIIPAGPSTVKLASSLVGINARDSFLLSMKNALSTTKLVKAGTLKTMKVTKKIHKMTGDIAEMVDSSISDNTLYLINKSVSLPKNAWSESLELTGEIKREMLSIEKRIREISIKYGEETGERLLLGSQQTFYAWNRYLKYLSSDMQAGAKKFDRQTSENSRKRFLRWWQAGRQGRKSIVKQGKQWDKSLSKVGSDIMLSSQSTGWQTDMVMSESGDEFYNNAILLGEGASANLIAAARSFNGWTEKKAVSHFEKSGQYIRGYLSLPKKMKQLGENQAESMDYFITAFKKSNKLREVLNEKLSVIWNNYTSSAAIDIKDTLENSKKELTENSSSIGYTLGAIKSLSWLAKLVVWDLILKPIGNVSVQAIGYVTVNGIVFPSMLIVTEGGATSIVASKLIYNTSMGVYELITPSVKAGLASSLALLEYTGGKVMSGAMLASSKPTEYGLKLGGKVGAYGLKGLGKASNLFLHGSGMLTGVAIKGTGKTLRVQSYMTGAVTDLSLKSASIVQSMINEPLAKVGHGAGYLGSHIIRWPGHGVASIVAGSGVATGHIVEVSAKTSGKLAAGVVRYIGIPTMTLAVPSSFTAAGVATGTVGTALGTGGYVAGKVASAGTLVFGNTLAATTAVVGTSASVAAGLTLSAYEFGKGLTVPAAYGLGSGVVMSYGMMTHLGAQSLLAVSDAAYLVLSLEGPRWVIYAVSGKLGNGKNLRPGTILELEKMQTAGEQFKVVPVEASKINQILEKM